MSWGSGSSHAHSGREPADKNVKGAMGSRAYNGGIDKLSWTERLEISSGTIPRSSEVKLAPDVGHWRGLEQVAELHLRLRLHITLVRASPPEASANRVEAARLGRSQRLHQSNLLVVSDFIYE
eukprot:3084601-Pyramimonas_sp.AAC.2